MTWSIGDTDLSEYGVSLVAKVFYIAHGSADKFVILKETGFGDF